jgi:hypothetical protein
MNLQETIELYHQNKLALTPLRDKEAFQKNWQKTKWSAENKLKTTSSSAGWVIPEDYIVVDVDNHDDQRLGSKNLKKMSEHYGFNFMAHAGIIVNTASGGLHLYYKKPKNFIGTGTKNSLSNFPSVEFKSYKRQVVIPNSTLSDGRNYSFHILSRTFSDIKELPENIMSDVTNGTSDTKDASLEPIENQQPLDAEIDQKLFQEFLLDQPEIFSGDRNNQFYKLACAGKEQGLSKKKITEFLNHFNDSRVHPKFDTGELRHCVNSAFRYSKNKSPVRSIAASFEPCNDEELPQITNLKTNQIKALSIEDFLSIKLPPREYIIEPIFPTQGLMMVYAKRGIGKTYFALHLACSIAGGFNIFGNKWKISKSRSVLYIDGEMPANTMQERLAGLVTSLPLITNSENLYIINPDHQHENHGLMPDLSEENGQKQIEEVITSKEIDVIIIDNLSTLCRTGKENESESWNSIGQWALKLRTKGKSIIFIHHAGKNDNQRGNSKKEDILDTVIKLKRPDDYQSNQGARFEIHFEKSRGFAGEGADPFEVSLKLDDNKTVWQVAEIEDLEIKMVLDLHQEKMTQREIAKALSFSPAKVNRLLKKSSEVDNEKF